MTDSIRPLMYRLTSRETEIFLLMGQGLSAGQISQQLNLSLRAIRLYQDRIREKLHIDSADDALAWEAVRWVKTCTDGCIGED